MKLFDIISYNRGRGAQDGNNYWNRVRSAHYVYICLMLLLLGIGIGLVSLFVCSAFRENIGWDIFLSYLESPAILALNIVPCVVLVFLFYFISGRAWVAFTVPAATVIIMSLINYYKIRIRTEPFTAKDFSLAPEMTNILSNYTIEVTGRALVAVFALIGGILFTVFLMRGVMKCAPVRIIGTVLAAALCVGLYVNVYSSDKVYDSVTNETERVRFDPWAQLDSYVSKGFLFPFLHTVKSAFPEKPEGYDEQETADMLAAYPEVHIPEDKKVNIIAVMLEAYADLSTIEEIKLTQDIYAPFHALQAEGVSGTLIANTYGGGTIDSERGFLTGYATHYDYNRKTNSYVHYLSSEGYVTEGAHPGTSWFYSRKNINEYLGFDNYYFLGELGGLTRDDSSFFSTLTAMYENRDKSVPYFNFSITYQNHGAYDTTTTVSESYVAREGLSEAGYNLLNNYLVGIDDTTKRIAAFADSLRDSSDPVVLVFFGDHMPCLGYSNEVFNDLDINRYTAEEEGFLNYYSTPVLIWANDAAKEALGQDFSGDLGTLSPCFLMNAVFDLCAWDAPAFMAVSNELYESVSVVSSATAWFCENGKLTTVLSETAAAAYERYLHAEFYTKYNFAG